MSRTLAAGSSSRLTRSAGMCERRGRPARLPTLRPAVISRARAGAGARPYTEPGPCPGKRSPHRVSPPAAPLFMTRDE